jgi:hypothetical protein
MPASLLKNLFIVLFLAACSSSRNSSQSSNDNMPVSEAPPQPEIASGQKPQSLMDLPQTQHGGFVLQPGFYEAEFKTYCLQPGTPDPRQGDAYLQGQVTGYRKEIVESVLRNSADHPGLDQKNIQLLLWSVVSGSSFNSLSYSVQRDAMQLLTPKQVFELKGGVLGLVTEVSSVTGLLNANSDIRSLFETSMASYEAYERIAVRSEPSRVVKKGVKYDQWYQQKEGYYVRYFPESYKKVKIQVYVPDNLLDTSNKLAHDYVVFDPTGRQAIPAFTNAQRLGIGAPVIDILRKVIIINKQPTLPRKVPGKTKAPETDM